MAHPSCHRTVAHHAIIHHFVVHRSIIIGRTGVVKKQPDVSQCSRTRVFTFFHLTRDTVAIMLASTLQNIAANQRSSTSSKDSEMESKASCSASPSACRVCCIVRVFVCGLACRLKHLRPNSRRMHCCVPPHGLPRGKEHGAVPDGQQSIRSTSRIHMSTRRFAHREKRDVPSSHVVPFADAEIFLPQHPPQENLLLRLHARSPMKLAYHTARNDLPGI